VDKEAWLYFLKHGPVFHDPLGEFTARKRAFSQYPADVRYRVISDVCLGIWADGEYKFCRRLIHRRDPFVIAICLGDFIRGIMRLCFLIEDDYAPHSYWLPHQFRKLPSVRSFLPKLRRLIRPDGLTEKAEAVQDICHMLRKRMVKVGLLDTADPTYGLGYHEIKAKIKDKWLREVFTLAAGR